MIRKIPLFSLGVGAAMGLMMLWMLHGMVSGDDGPQGAALALFIGAHVAIVAVVGLGTLFAARLHPRLRGWMARVHRPSMAHMGSMLGGAVIAAAIAHLMIHGGL